MVRNKTPAQDFDKFLAENLHNSSPYIDDAGFTENVLRALPQGSARKSKSRWLWISGGAAMACLAAPSVAATVTDVFHWVYQMDLSQLIQLGLLTSCVTFGAALVWLARELDWI